MSDEGEKTCPLCAEEMDLTDQQLRPCKCGYDICVWCWHHIMDMAEKDDTEGRCPACRTPYNKEKIVGTASKCERLVSEMSVEKKQKSLKGKTKTSEGRKQLSSVRVIQRNLVYIVGLPLNLADEDLLQRKEYFGQYGKVLKVSISRTAAGSIQHFANNTCSVYITYSKEDEAVRSIQSVHGFVLEGRPLRACFGTTKYCHAWLRNMPCTNPDCLYLHEFGSQEDSFTKDEIISEYTRVQQVTGITNDIQRRSGNFLPPAADDYSNNTTSSWAKPISKTPTNDTTNSMKVSPPNSSSGRSVALPAAASWGTHASNSQPLAANAVSSNGTLKQKVDTCTSTTTTATLSFSTAVVSPSSHSNGILKNHSEESKLQHHHPESATSTINSHLCTAAPNDKNDSMQSSETAPDKDKDVVSDEEGIQKLSSLSIGRNHGLGLQPCEDEKLVQVQPFTSNKPKKGTNTNTNTNPNPNPNPTMDNKRQVFCLEPEPEPDFQNNVEEEEEEEEEEEVAVSEAEAEVDLLSFNDQRLRDPEVVTHTSYIQNVPQSSHVNQTCYSPFGNQNLDRGGSLLNTINMPVANGHSSNGDVNSFFEGSNGHSYINKQIGMFDDTTAKRDHHISSNNNNNGSIDLGENSIISNILSMDFDPWDESLTSPQNLAKLLGNNSDKQERSVSSRKTQNCNQSRFSFAREEDQGSNFNFTQSFNDFGQNLNHQNMNMNMKRDFVSNTDENGFSAFNFEESDNRSAGNYSSNKISVSRSQISAPPGFMGPSRAPPPGFTSNERIEQTYDNLSGNHMFESGSIMRKMHQHQHQAAAAPVYNGGELELMDPAILAIGGSRVDMMRSSSNFPSQQHAVASSYENDNRLRLLMQSQRSSFTHQTQNQNQRFSELGLGGDGYGVPSRILEQNNNRSSYQQGGFQQPRISNGHWDGWNEVGNGNGNDIAMAELLRNERLGFNKYYSSGYGYEDTKFRMPSSGDLYNNRTFGI
ncbi:uncharacterized protein LOC111882575 isoform X2 [Lactuca sativa]|uniref:uncharacterized protein LOC111882575 isoform X2 n=1 Tax=Lactuca sativa TaxID=4236 RepID=UPI001C68974F|nr:uncharacterized protein LOC111882575 isoform X2 [Lactuca sativa]